MTNPLSATALRAHISAALLSALLLPVAAPAQENLVFQAPPPEILALADFKRAPSVSLDSRREYMLLSYYNTYKTLEELNQEEMRLAGLRVNPVTNISSELTYVNNLKIRKVAGTEETQVSGLPPDPRIAYVSWSPDEKKIAFTHTSGAGVELWYIDVAAARAARLTGAVLNANLGMPYNWLADSGGLLARLLPPGRPALIDTKKELPKGPSVSVGDGSKSQVRTYQDLLRTPDDEKNFEALVTSELHLVPLAGGARLFKPAAMYAGESVSPDGKYVLVTTLHRPFSYMVPLGRFPQKAVVYTLSGAEVKVVNEVPLTEVMPKGFSSVRKGRRALHWRYDTPATLAYAEALDGGDQAVKAEFRDEVFMWEAPFASAPVSLLRTRQRFGGITWGDADTAVAYENWYDTRNLKTFLIDPSRPGAEPRTIFDRNFQDIYSDPGGFETRRLSSGRRVLLEEGGKAYLLGEGHTRAGQFPFVDELDLATLAAKRLYQSSFTDKKEDLLTLDDPAGGTVLARIQSKTEFPNYYFRNIRSGELRRLTDFPNPFEAIRDVHKEVIKYKRADGVELSGTLYLPAGYDRVKKDKLPLLIWAYPREFKDKDSAGQSDKNPNEFTYPNRYSFIYWVTRGYAVLDDASFPIVGKGKKEPNDTFIKQLKATAEATVDAVDRLGYIDRKKVCVGGHSYGAFMTANLLTHTRLFACGVAMSGSYNRTLTPFGFQTEQRNYWDNPGLYNGMSPFMTADRMKTPLLLVHGEADNNPGTFTLQSERYFQALKNLGAPVRMVLLPKETHGYYARENIMHLLWEQDQFFGKYLKK
ncbi:MAG: prolyl oligopeptidase family serine peptidase [Elusimicrobiales bacterium]